jgi:hypothetical protein
MENSGQYGQEGQEYGDEMVSYKNWTSIGRTTTGGRRNQLRRTA